QAEDGIRDRDVTGVQTCALPIWLRVIVVVLEFGALPLLAPGGARRERAPLLEALPHEGSDVGVIGDGLRHDVPGAPEGGLDVRRSEERRVGKEGTERWVRRARGQ